MVQVLCFIVFLDKGFLLKNLNFKNDCKSKFFSISDSSKLQNSSESRSKLAISLEIEGIRKRLLVLMTSCIFSVALPKNVVS